VARNARVKGCGRVIAATEVSTAKEHEDECEDTESKEDDDDHDNPLPMIIPPAHDVSGVSLGYSTRSHDSPTVLCLFLLTRG
jgi:hypothetical protein